MITAIIIIGIAFGWLAKETNFLRVHLQTGKDKPVITTPVDKTLPYWWQFNKDNMILCNNCWSCNRKKTQFAGWKLPARTIKAWGSTMTFKEGCNIARADLLRDIARLQNRKYTPTLKGAQVFPHDNNKDYYDDLYEPTIDILIDGVLKSSINGNYKRGLIADTLKPYITKSKGGRKRVISSNA